MYVTSLKARLYRLVREEEATSHLIVLNQLQDDKESKSKNHILAMVEDNTNKIFDIIKDKEGKPHWS